MRAFGANPTQLGVLGFAVLGYIKICVFVWMLWWSLFTPILRHKNIIVYYVVELLIILKLINPVLHHINVNAKYLLIINTLCILL